MREGAWNDRSLESACATDGGTVRRARGGLGGREQLVHAEGEREGAGRREHSPTASRVDVPVGAATPLAMTEPGIEFQSRLIELVRSSSMLMRALRAARAADPPDWLIGGGVIRDLVWDHLHDPRQPSHHLRAPHPARRRRDARARRASACAHGRCRSARQDPRRSRDHAGRTPGWAGPLGASARST